MVNGYHVRVKSNRPLVRAILAVAEAVTNVGGLIVGAIDDLRAEHARGAANLVQVGTDLNELLDRIAVAAEAGDPVQTDIDAAKALADGLAATGAQIDAILAAAPPPDPEPAPPVEGRNRR